MVNNYLASDLSNVSSDILSACALRLLLADRCAHCNQRSNLPSTQVPYENRSKILNTECEWAWMISMSLTLSSVFPNWIERNIFRVQMGDYVPWRSPYSSKLDFDCRSITVAVLLWSGMVIGGESGGGSIGGSNEVVGCLRCRDVNSKRSVAVAWADLRCLLRLLLLL